MDLSEYQSIKYDNEYFSGDAEWLHKRIYSFVKHFEKTLKDKEALIAQVILNNGSSIRVNTFGYYQPDVITIDGTDSNDKNVFLILPYNNIQIQFSIKTNEQETDKTKYSIGFKSY